MKHLALMMLLDLAIVVLALLSIHLVETIIVGRIERQIDADAERRRAGMRLVRDEDGAA